MYEKPPGQKAPATPPVTRVVIANPNAVPLCLTSAVVGDDPQEKVIYGDSMGSVAAVRCHTLRILLLVSNLSTQVYRLRMTRPSGPCAACMVACSISCSLPSWHV